jgi:hypothetical protein
LKDVSVLIEIPFHHLDQVSINNQRHIELDNVVQEFTAQHQVVKEIDNEQIQFLVEEKLRNYLKFFVGITDALNFAFVLFL